MLHGVKELETKSLMKTIALVCVLIAAASHTFAADYPTTDSFQLMVEEPVQNSGCRVFHVKIFTQSAEWMEVSWDNGANMGGRIPVSRNGNGHEGVIALSSMVGQNLSVCHTTTTVNDSALMPVSYDLAPGAKFDSIVTLRVTNGVYKVSQPIVIGARNGEIMKLVVRQK